MVVRSGSLADSMSSYLINQIAATRPVHEYLADPEQFAAVEPLVPIVAR